MEFTFNKIRISHNNYGLPTKIDELKDKIIVDLSKHIVTEIIKGEKQENVWPYSEINETHINGVYTLSIGGKGYFNDWNFKPKSYEKLVIWIYKYKNIIFSYSIGSIFGGLISNIFSYFLTLFL